MAKTSTVPTARSKDAIRGLLIKSGAKDFAPMERISPDGLVTELSLCFNLPIKDKLVPFVVKIPIIYPNRSTLSGKQALERVVYRNLFLWLEFNLDMAKKGVIDLEMMLLPWIKIEATTSGQTSWRGLPCLATHKKLLALVDDNAPAAKIPRRKVYAFSVDHIPFSKAYYLLRTIRRRSKRAYEERAGAF